MPKRTSRKGNSKGIKTDGLQEFSGSEDDFQDFSIDPPPKRTKKNIIYEASIQQVTKSSRLNSFDPDQKTVERRSFERKSREEKKFEQELKAALALSTQECNGSIISKEKPKNHKNSSTEKLFQENGLNSHESSVYQSEATAVHNAVDESGTDNTKSSEVHVISSEKKQIRLQTDSDVYVNSRYTNDNVEKMDENGRECLNKAGHGIADGQRKVKRINIWQTSRSLAVHSNHESGMAKTIASTGFRIGLSRNSKILKPLHGNVSRKRN